MGYKKKIFSDKTIIAAAAVGVLAISAIAGGIMLAGTDDDKVIVDLDEGGRDNVVVEKESGHVVSDDKNIIAENVDNKTPDNNSNKDSYSNTSGEEPKTQGTNVSEKESDKLVVDNSSEENDDELLKNQSGDKSDENIQDANVGNGILGLNFSADSTLVWPVEGNVIIDYDMENTVSVMEMEDTYVKDTE